EPAAHAVVGRHEVVLRLRLDQGVAGQEIAGAPAGDVLAAVVVVIEGDKGALSAHEPGGLAVARALRGLGQSAADGAQAVERAVGHQARTAACSSIERQMTRPPSPPISASEARSGWGIIPSTLLPALRIPAMFSMEPLGLAARVVSPSGVQ